MSRSTSHNRRKLEFEVLARLREHFRMEDTLKIRKERKETSSETGVKREDNLRQIEANVE